MYTSRVYTEKYSYLSNKLLEQLKFLLIFLKSGLSTDGETDSVLLVGPTAPTTNRLSPVPFSASLAALLANPAAALLIRYV